MPTCIQIVLAVCQLTQLKIMAADVSAMAERLHPMN